GVRARVSQPQDAPADFGARLLRFFSPYQAVPGVALDLLELVAIDGQVMRSVRGRACVRPQKRPGNGHACAKRQQRCDYPESHAPQLAPRNGRANGKACDQLAATLQQCGDAADLAPTLPQRRPTAVRIAAGGSADAARLSGV